MDVVTRFEEQYTELEARITNLKKALSHWQALELDYEGVKDEIIELSDDTTKIEYQTVAREFGPEKLSEKELDELFEPTKGKVRTPKQVVDALSKRIEYVGRNISTLKTQIDTLERQRESLTGDGLEQTETALPEAEILEELDENENILSSKVQQQGDSASRVIDVLKQVEHKISEELPGSSTSKLENQIEPEIPAIPSAGDVSEIQEAEEDSDSSIDLSKSAQDDDDSDVVSLNRDDTEEEAQLRREMLQYGLEEVGNIVAELELEDDDTASDAIVEELSDEAHSDGSETDTLDEDEDEDDYGRTRSSKQSAAYRKQMEDLQKRLGVSLENVGPFTTVSSQVLEHVQYPSTTETEQYMSHLPPSLRKRLQRPSAKEAARDAAIARENASKKAGEQPECSSTTNSNRNNKKVSFASELDIAEERPAKPSTSSAITSEDVVERVGANPTVPAATKGPSKPSKFKASRAKSAEKPSILKSRPSAEITDETTSAEIAGKTPTHSDVLVERPTPRKQPAPPEADDFDEELQKRQIAMEHHKLKNLLVHNQGGYVQGGELDNWGDELVPPEVMDERTGEPKKISRFKAARLKS